MANFPVFQGGQLTSGVAKGLAIREQKEQRKAITAQQEQEKALAGAELLLSNLDARRARTEKAVEETAKGLRAGAAMGKGPAELKKIRRFGEAAVSSYLTYVNGLIKAGGTPEVAQFFGDPVAFADQQKRRLDMAMELGRGETGAAKGRQTAEEQTALVRTIAQNLGITEEQAAQAAGFAPGPGTVQRALVGGQPAFVQQVGDRFQPVPGATPIPTGMDISVGPDGGITLRTGERLAKPSGSTLTQLQKSVVDSNDQIARLTALQREFRPEFLTIGGKVKGGIANIKDVAGLDLSDDEKKFLTDFTAFSQKAFENMNSTITEMTGAQMSEFEAKRLRKGLPDPENDGPTQFETKMNSGIESIMLARARSLFVLEQGLDANPWEVIGIDEMSKIIDARVAELEAQLGDRNKALDQAAKEFGL